MFTLCGSGEHTAGIVQNWLSTANEEGLIVDWPTKTQRQQALSFVWINTQLHFSLLVKSVKVETFSPSCCENPFLRWLLLAWARDQTANGQVQACRCQAKFLTYYCLSVILLLRVME